MRVAIDASAVLAFLRNEPGGDVVEQHLRSSCLSAINLSEVLEKVLSRERGVERVLALLKNWQVELVPFDAEQAELAAGIKLKIGRADVSLADRACLALAAARRLPALTANRLWAQLPLDTEVILIRGGLV